MGCSVMLAGKLEFLDALIVRTNIESGTEVAHNYYNATNRNRVVIINVRFFQFSIMGKSRKNIPYFNQIGKFWIKFFSI